MAGRGIIKAEMTEAQYVALCDRLAAMKGKERSGPKVRAMLEDEYGLKVCNAAVYTLLQGDFQKHLDTIKAARELAHQIGTDEGSGDHVAGASNLILQQMVLDRALELKAEGKTLNDPAVLAELTELHKVADAGLKAKDRKAITVARVAKMEVELEQLKKEREAITQDLKSTTLTQTEREARMRARFGM